MARRGRSRGRRAGKPHMAYCMMVRAAYDLWPKGEKKRSTAASAPKTKSVKLVKKVVYPTISLRDVSEDAKPFVRTENAMRRKNADGELPDEEIVSWCVKSIRRKKLPDPTYLVRCELVRLGCEDTMSAIREVYGR